MARKQQGVGLSNDYYTVMQTVEVGGVSYDIYGSMSWTVAQARKKDWAETRVAYVSLTGDTREIVNRDDATNVVAGELQLSWAEVKNRKDLIPNLKANQEKRIKFALESIEPEGGSGRNNRASTRRKTTGGSMAKKEKQEGAEGAEAKAPVEKRTGPTGKTIPTRGGMGLAAQLIEGGERDEAVIVEKVKEAFPDAADPTRHIRYVAKQILQVELTRPAAAAPAAE